VLAGHSSSVGKTTLLLLDEKLALRAEKTVPQRFTHASGVTLWRVNGQGPQNLQLRSR
jgi:hypothetical protein